MTGCWGVSDDQVTIYTAVDSEHSSVVLDAFAASAKISPQPVYDAESTKTVGLVNRLRQESSRPRCDVFWNNEVLHTILLEREGLLAHYPVVEQADVRGGFCSSAGFWTGIAARPRILLINTELLPDPDEWPASVEELADKKWAQRVAFARPFFGTTKTHFLVLFHKWGPQRSEEFFRNLRANAVMLDGNKQVAQAVARGQIAAGLTDTDDAIIEIENGAPLTIVYPDHDGIGTLFIPNTVALVRGAPHPRQGKRLVEFLTSKPVESLLAEGESAQFPLLANDVESRLPVPGDLRWMEVDFEKVADGYDDGMKMLTTILGR
jgi:iron(III) transport system substrate-binding protein